MSINERPETQRQKKAARTRSVLMETASGLFNEYGFERVTIEDITQRAGFSKGTFYSHFSSKEDIYLEQFLQIDERYAEVFSAEDTKDLSTYEKIMLLVDCMCNYCADECGLNTIQVICSHQMLGHTEVVLNNSNREIYNILYTIADEGRDSGEIPQSIDNDQFASTILRFMHGLIYDWCLENGAFDLKQEGPLFFSRLLNSISV